MSFIYIHFRGLSIINIWSTGDISPVPSYTPCLPPTRGDYRTMLYDPFSLYISLFLLLAFSSLNLTFTIYLIATIIYINVIKALSSYYII